MLRGETVDSPYTELINTDTGEIRGCDPNGGGFRVCTFTVVELAAIPRIDMYTELWNMSCLLFIA